MEKRTKVLLIFLVIALAITLIFLNTKQGISGSVVKENSKEKPKDFLCIEVEGKTFCRIKTAVNITPEISEENLSITKKPKKIK